MSALISPFFSLIRASRRDLHFLALDPQQLEAGFSPAHA
jgi:hypothetical protein